MITVFIREDEAGVCRYRIKGIGIAENKRKSLFVRFELVDRIFSIRQAPASVFFFGEGTGRDAQGYDFR